MSRISQTLSLLSNLSTFSAGPETKVEDERVQTITEQFLPRKQDAVFGDQFIFQTASLRQRINAKLTLLAPLPCDVPPFAKSVIYLSSLSGAINATVYRPPDAETHFFRLCIFAREGNVKVTLPSLFRGVVHVKTREGSCRRRRARYCHDDDDEVYIHTEGSVELRLMSSANGGSENMGSRVGRHVRQIFGTM